MISRIEMFILLLAAAVLGLAVRYTSASTSLPVAGSGEVLSIQRVNYVNTRTGRVRAKVTILLPNTDFSKDIKLNGSGDRLMNVISASDAP